MLAPDSELVAGTSRPTGGRVARRSGAAMAAAGALALLGALAAFMLAGAHSARTQAPSAPRAIAHTASATLPAGALGPVTAALGAHDHAYFVSAGGGVLRAANPAQGLRATFSGAATTIASGSLALGFEPRAAGYGNTLRALGAASTSAAANRVRAALGGGLSQWYRNGPLGLEQGFTLARPLQGRAGATLTLALGLSGNARAKLAGGGRSVLFSHPGAATLSYGSLWATDARGRALPSSLALRGGELLLRVDVRGARYPLTIDPLVQQAKLHPEGGTGRFGRTVALSADGNTALVGLPHERGDHGAAWVFTRLGAAWSETAAIEGKALGATNYFGRWVALSANGETALIGDPGANGFAGDAWVFVHSGDEWTTQQKLTPAAGEELGEGNFGRSVALSEDGNTALVGAFGDNGDAGAAWVFARSAGAWTQQGAKLVPAAGQESGSAEFGRNVAISGDGATALIGAPLDDGRVGAAWAFTWSGGAWTQQGGKLTGAGEDSKGEFGAAVALSSDGSTALIGASQEDRRTGAAYVLSRSGSAWAQQARFVASGELPPGAFGTSVALSADGGVGLVGALADDGDVGAAWVFADTASGWSQQGAKLTAEEELGEGEFGWSVALSADASTALIGGLADAEEAGAAWVFTGEARSPEGGGPGGGGSTAGNTNTGPTNSGNSVGTGSGGVAGFQNSQLPPPVLGQSGNLALVSGTVMIELPGTNHFVALTGSEHIPFGTIIDATHGSVTLTVVGPDGQLEVAHYFGGRFLLTQSHSGVVVATLEGGNFAACKRSVKHAGVTASAARSKKPVRKLWTNAHGSFTTKGTYAAGAVQGTEWLTEDFCSSTLVIVTRDRVKVTDLVRHHSVIVRAGHRYRANAK